MRNGILLGLAALLGWSSAPAQGPSAAQKQATIAWIQACQKENGGFAVDRGPKTPATLRATTAAIRALHYFGGQLQEKKRCAAFVVSCYDKGTTGFAPLPGGKADVLTTAVGLMAVKELNLKEPLYQTKPRGYLCSHAKSFEEVRLAAAALESLRARCEQADRWITDIKAKRNPDGTYGKGRGAARYTAGAVVTLLRLGAAVDHPDKVLKVLQDGQRPDGAWGTAEEEGSDLETTYRVMRAFVMLKAKPHDVRACQRFLSRCRQDNGSYAVRPGQTGNMASTYFAGIVLHWLDNAR